MLKDFIGFNFNKEVIELLLKLKDILATLKNYILCCGAKEARWPVRNNEILKKHNSGTKVAFPPDQRKSSRQRQRWAERTYGIGKRGSGSLTSRSNSQDRIVVPRACPRVALEGKFGRDARRNHVLQVPGKDSNGGGIIAPVATVILHALVHNQISAYRQT
jgi:hypothetical protein